ncbi:hypothetical protein ACSTS3_15205 [Aquimarina muelleri]|uniref:hypothetical protein n=1 Tax=Aquimarina muelleri TaxID=279356 RepID=UPI003F6845EC
MKNYFKIILVCILAVFFYNCDGEDGADGLTGENGINGTNGNDGINGENGVGFDELVKYGSIKLTLTGTRPDNVSFTDSSEFKFTPIEGNNLNYTNSVFKTSSSISFQLLRFLSAPDDIFQETTTGINFVVNNPGEDTQSIDFSISITNYAIIVDDNKYFVVNNYFNGNGSGVTNFNIINYNFNEETNNLTFSFSFNVDRLNNSTGNDLTASGEVDVKVLERIQATR